ncbi:MAG: hypothetical protein E6R04_02965 [Spirochaetes bacterium]|nr:MAG: hypothetical protein E6R04_02965 [Spirochaetota bacterium]
MLEHLSPKAFSVLAALGISVSPFIISPAAHADTTACQASVVDASIEGVLDKGAIEAAVASTRSVTGMDVYVRAVQTLPHSGVASWWEDMYRSCHSWMDSQGTYPSPNILVIGFDVDSKSSILGHGKIPLELGMALNRIHSDKLDAGMGDGNFTGAVEGTLSALSEMGDIASKAVHEDIADRSGGEDKRFSPEVLGIAAAVIVLSIVFGVLTITFPARREQRRRKSEAEADEAIRVRANARHDSVKPSVTVPQRTAAVVEAVDEYDDDELDDDVPLSTDLVSRSQVDDYVLFALTRDARTLMDEIRFVGRYMEKHGLSLNGRKEQLSHLVSRYNAAGNLFRENPLYARRELDSMMADVEILKHNIGSDLNARALPGSLPPALQTRQSAVEAAIQRALNSAPRAIESGRHAMSEPTGRHSL